MVVDYLPLSSVNFAMPQVRAPSYKVRGFHFASFGALTWAGKFLRPSENLELLADPRLARLRLRVTWGHQAGWPASANYGVADTSASRVASSSASGIV